MATGHNAIPLLIIPKISSLGDQLGLCMVFDKCEQNMNTYKLVSLLPDIEEILHEVSKHKFWSLIDGKDAYEQIQVIPECVSYMLFTTPVSLDMIFTLLFCPFSTQLPPIFLLFPSLMSYHAHKQTTRTQFDLLLQVTNTTIYLATDTLKQSCSFSATQSCTGTSSAALACSHSSQFWTSRTRSMSRSASTTQRP